MLSATWNLNNRVGKVRLSPEAANAAIGLGTDVMIFNEYYPQQNDATLGTGLCEFSSEHYATEIDGYQLTGGNVASAPAHGAAK